MLFDNLTPILRDVLVFLDYRVYSGDITLWNDAPNRRHEDVLKLLDEVIADT